MNIYLSERGRAVLNHPKVGWPKNVWCKTQRAFGELPALAYLVVYIEGEEFRRLCDDFVAVPIVRDHLRAWLAGKGVWLSLQGTHYTIEKEFGRERRYLSQAGDWVFSEQDAGHWLDVDQAYLAAVEATKP